jgi:carboxyl-terminal processing protease
MQNKKNITLPLVIGLAIALGVFLGYFLSENVNNNQEKQTTVINFSSALKKSPQTEKLNKVLNYIEKHYVDPIDKDELVETVIEKFLAELDPHSFYISADEFQAMNEPLQGNFDGIGVEFMIQEDTVVVVNPIVGGPSEKVGVRAGDRIIKVEGENIAGTGIKNRDVMKLLRGKKGSTVNITNHRKSENKTIDFEITRDKIPIYSVDASIMLEDKTGYIKITRFGGTTVDEFNKAMKDLLVEGGMKRLILDLRGNGGGYLNAAVEIADMFLPENTLIVYTEGKAVKRKDYKASRFSPYADLPLVVLINQESASASEVLAGALQDNDRAAIVGKRSFGKGLVQDQVPFTDGAALRLTVSRYYTPSGRSIQKPYGKGIKYGDDLANRFDNGELVSADSIKKVDSLMYFTKAGRPVFGGGGITPDIFVPLDTTTYGMFFTEAFYLGLFNKFAFEFSDNNRDDFKRTYGSAQNFITNFKAGNDFYANFVAFVKKNNLSPNQQEIIESKNAITSRLKALIGRNIFGNDAFYYEVLKNDSDLKIALDALENPNTWLNKNLSAQNND